VSTLRLYDYAASANCYKVRLLLAQLGVPYERVPVDIFAGDTLTDDYAVVNPARETPVLEYAPRRFLAESGAILVYLASGTPLLPDDREGLAEVCRWLLYEQTAVIPVTGGLRFRLQTGRLQADDPRAPERRRRGVELLGLLERHLEQADYFAAGRYTIADVAMFGYLHVAHEAGLPMHEFRALEEWLARVAGQPGYMNDLEPYPENAGLGASRSIYDARAHSSTSR
jgi:glutathione S-transferase